MRGLEDPRVLDANRGQFVDVEEAAVVDLVHRDPPEGRPVGLLGDQAVDLVEAVGIADPAVEPVDGCRDGGSNLRARLFQGGEPPLDDRDLAITLGLAFLRESRSRREVLEGRSECCDIPANVHGRRPDAASARRSGARGSCM